MTYQMVGKDDANRWARSVCENGTGFVRKAYLEQYGAGEIAKRFWNDPTFTLGVEYGILIAVAKMYGDLQETNNVAGDSSLVSAGKE